MIKSFRTSLVTVVLVVFCVGCSSIPDEKMKSYGYRMATREDGQGKYAYYTYGLKEDPARGPKALYEARVLVGDKRSEVIGMAKGFTKIIPYSDKRAIVEIQTDGKSHLADYNFDEDKMTPLPTTEYVDLDGVVFSYNPPKSPEQAFDLYFHSPFANAPRVLKRIGGGSLHQMKNSSRRVYDNLQRPAVFLDPYVVIYKNFLVIYSIGEHGRPVSQILDLKGEPLSPQIGYVYRAYWGIADTQALSLVGQVPGEYMNKEQLYLPIDEGGRFEKLPTEAVGVIPITQPNGVTMAWAIMFPDEKGLMGVVHSEQLSKAPESLAKAPRFTDFFLMKFKSAPGSSLGASDLFLRLSSGRWVFHKNSTMIAMNSGIGAQELETQEQAKAYLESYEQKVLNFRAAERAAEQKVIDEKNRLLAVERAKRSQQMAEKLAAQKDICDRFRVALEAGPETGARFLKECDVPYMTWIDIAAESGVEYSVIENARIKFKERVKQEERTRLRLEEERKQRQYSRGGGLLEHLAKTTGSPSSAGGPVAPSQQQQRYQWERDLNRKLYQRDYDPYQ